MPLCKSLTTAGFVRNADKMDRPLTNQRATFKKVAAATNPTQNMNAQPPLSEIVAHIDKVLGKGYAREHPDLIGQYLLAHAIREIDETLAQAVSLVSKIGPTGLFKFLTR